MEASRALGAFYTPAVLAEPLAQWAVRQGTDTVFDPSCGEGAFLTCGVDRLLALGAAPRRLPDQIAGVEIDVKALARARAALLSRHPGLRWGRLAQDDFFLFAEENHGVVAFDAVVGNPPYLRTQGRSEASKRRALAIARRAGAELTADASVWAPFAAAASAFVKPGGRLAMVVPREALFTNYTRPLLSMLERRFASVHLVALNAYWFEGAMVKVALLLAEGVGPGVLRLHEASEIANLGRLIEAAPTPVPAPSWVWSRIPADCRGAAGRALENKELAPLAELAILRIGVVTGEKDYFLLTPAKREELGIPRDCVKTSLSKPSQLAGATFSSRDAALLEGSGDSCQLLALPAGYSGGFPGVDAYLAQGLARGIDLNYKCRTRKPWYSVRRQLPPPDAFLGYLVKRRPRFAANLAGVHCTNNLHRIYLKPPRQKLSSLVAAAAINAASMLSLELLGRIGAAGVLKIEPGDAPKIRLVRPEALATVRGVAEATSAIDAALRDDRDEDAFAIADDLASRALGWNPRETSKLRRAAAALRDARLRSVQASAGREAISGTQVIRPA